MTVSMDLYDEIAEVGGRFTGRLRREPDAPGESSKARAVRLSLRCRTEGRGDVDEHVVDQHEFTLDSRQGLDVEFSLRVPAIGPISYDGSLLRVIWEIEARIDLKMARDPRTERVVLVVPEGAGSVYDRPHPLQVFG